MLLLEQFSFSVSRKTEPKYSQPLIGAKVAFIISQIELQITSGILRTIKPFLRGSNYVKNIPAVVLQTIVLLRGSTHVSQSSTHLFRPMIAPVYLNDFCLRAQFFLHFRHDPLPRHSTQWESCQSQSVRKSKCQSENGETQQKPRIKQKLIFLITYNHLININ